MPYRRTLVHIVLSCSFILALFAPSVQQTVNAQEPDRSIETIGSIAQHQAQDRSEVREVIVKIKQDTRGTAATLHRSLGRGLVSHSETADSTSSGADG